MAFLPPPLTLYIHIPWCVSKCPYCDFNSHAIQGPVDELDYIDLLLSDFTQDLSLVGHRPLQSLFIGGGTPSLFTPNAIKRLLSGIRGTVDCVAGMEVTMEANPGTLEASHFAGYRDAGVTRLSIGIQSFSPPSLQALGRIHTADEAVLAVELAKQAGFDRLNLDLMFGLPMQSLAAAEVDLSTALALDPGHISYYQLTLEPNTAFHQVPPTLPGTELLWQMQQQGHRLLQQAGYLQYEISAFAQPGQVCRHNLNYWQFGDYLGIGAGAHAKLTLGEGEVIRRVKQRHPNHYRQAILRGDVVREKRLLSEEDRILESMMNLLRLQDGFNPRLFEQRTGLPLSVIEPQLAMASEQGLLVETEDRIKATSLGYRFLNELLTLFMPD